MEKKTVQIYEPHKEWMDQVAESEGVTHAEVQAKLIEEYSGEQIDHVCPQCEGRFTLDDVDVSTIREHGAINTDVRYLLKGNRTVKDFECPHCEERISPDDAEMSSPVSSDDVSQEEA